MIQAAHRVCETESRGFDFTGAMDQLCRDITTRLEEMWHIDMSRVAVSFAQARKRTSHGLHASLTPLRFEHGRRRGLMNGQRYFAQKVFDEGGREMLYILTFYLPRFLDTPLDEKLVTIFHELWHIHP